MQLKTLLPFVALIVTVLGHPADAYGPLNPGYTTLPSQDLSPPPSHHGTLTFKKTANVTRVLVNNPPINLLTSALISDLLDFLLWTQPAPNKITPKVVIFSSAIPNFFIAHFDLKNLQPTLHQPTSANFITNTANTNITDTITTNTTTTNDNISGLSPLDALVACGRLLQNITSTAFIAEINGRTYGGGQELSSQMDMRFAGPHTLVAQYENCNGFVAEAGGQISLGPIIGKARAMEHLLASKAIDARTGTRLGLFNNDYPDARTLTREVDALAARIGLFPQSSLNDTKFSLAFMSPSARALDEQLVRFAAVEKAEGRAGTVSATLAASDEGDNAFEKGIPNSVVRALYGGVLAGLEDKGKAILSAARQVMH